MLGNLNTNRSKQRGGTINNQLSINTAPYINISNSNIKYVDLSYNQIFAISQEYEQIFKVLLVTYDIVTINNICTRK